MEVAAIAPPGRAGDRPGRRLPSRGRLDAAWRAVSRGRREVPEAELALRISEAGMSATATDGATRSKGNGRPGGTPYGDYRGSPVLTARASGHKLRMEVDLRAGRDAVLAAITEALGPE